MRFIITVMFLLNLVSCSNSQSPSVQGPSYFEIIQDAMTHAGLDPDHVVLMDVMYSYTDDSAMIIVVDTMTKQKYYLTLRSNEFVGSHKGDTITEQEVLQLQTCTQQQNLHASPKSLFAEALEYDSSMKRADFTAVWQGECSDEWMLHGYGTFMTADLEYGKITEVVNIEDRWK